LVTNHYSVIERTAVRSSALDVDVAVIVHGARGNSAVVVADPAGRDVPITLGCGSARIGC
jgi:hypothetical protein